MSGQDDGLASQRDWIVYLVTRALRARGATDISYDADELVLRYRSGDGTPLAADLARLFHDCVTADADERAAHIERFLAVDARIPQLRAGWRNVAGLLRPVLRPAGWVEGQQLGGAALPLAREFQPLLNEMVVIDQPDVMAYVHVEQLGEWGVTESEVFRQARANLTELAVAAPPVGDDDRPVAISLTDTGDEYWASHLLINGWLSRMASVVGGRPVVFLPDTTGLMVAQDEPAELWQLFEWSEKQYREASRPVSPQAYTVDDAGLVVPYTAAEDDPLWSVVHRSEVLFAAAEYTAQAKRHAQALAGEIGPLFVKDLPDGGMYSVAVWGEGVLSLLPRADYVTFVNEVEYLTVPWEVVEHEAGLAPEPGWSPPRYRVQQWPERPVMSRLHASATSLGQV